MIDDDNKGLQPHGEEGTGVPEADAGSTAPADSAAPYQPYVPQIQMPRKVVRGRRRRERTPLPLRNPLMIPLGFVVVMLAVFTYRWFTTPIETASGASSTRGQQVGKFLGNLVNPKESLEKSFNGKQQLTVLLIGLDHVPPTKKDPGIIRRNDSTLVASTDFKSKQIRLASIPRDGWVQHWQNGKSFGYDKFGHTYAYGQQLNLKKKEDLAAGGISRVTETTEKLLEIEVDHYVVIEFDGFIKLIDAMGGLEIDVEKDMYHRDRAGGLLIDLKKGKQLLDGERVMHYARFRKDAMGDKGRMLRQQKVIKLALKKMASPAMLPRLPQLAKLFNESVRTSLSPDQLLALVQHVEDYNMDETETMSMPSYWAGEPGHERTLPGLSAEQQKFHSFEEYIAPSDMKKVHDFLMDLNAPPKAVASISPEGGAAPLTITVDASRSTDRDGKVVGWECDWNGDGNFEAPQTESRFSHEFSKAGEYSFNVRVLDDQGKPSPPQNFKLKVDPPAEQAAADGSAGQA